MDTDIDTDTDTDTDIDTADIGISSWFCFSGEPWLIQGPDPEVVANQGPEVCLQDTWGGSTLRC